MSRQTPAGLRAIQVQGIEACVAVVGAYRQQLTVCAQGHRSWSPPEIDLANQRMPRGLPDGQRTVLARGQQVTSVVCILYESPTEMPLDAVGQIRVGDVPHRNRPTQSEDSDLTATGTIGQTHRGGDRKNTECIGIWIVVCSPEAVETSTGSHDQHAPIGEDSCGIAAACIGPRSNPLRRLRRQTP